MADAYYCAKCNKFALAVRSRFYHPHEGWRTCLRCNKCGGMVTIKEQEGK